MNVYQLYYLEYLGRLYVGNSNIPRVLKLGLKYDRTLFGRSQNLYQNEYNLSHLQHVKCLYISVVILIKFMPQILFFSFYSEIKGKLESCLSNHTVSSPIAR